jgi:hypothetical protein
MSEARRSSDRTKEEGEENVLSKAKFGQNIEKSKRDCPISQLRNYSKLRRKSFLLCLTPVFFFR